ncbi:STAS domain-containing protein [Spirillospora sp. CA-255316]
MLERLQRCERDLGLLLGSGGATAVCQFDRRRCAPAELDALGAAHGIAVAPDPEFEDPVLRVVRTFQPPGLAFSGELDASRHTVLVQALAAVMTSAGDEEVHLDLGGLGFIDLGALNILARTAGQSGNRAPLVLDHLSPQLRTLLETVGWHMLPGLRLGS